MGLIISGEIALGRLKSHCPSAVSLSGATDGGFFLRWRTENVVGGRWTKFLEDIVRSGENL